MGLCWVLVHQLFRDGNNEGYLAYQALLANQNQQAVSWCRAALRIEPANANAWYNLGVAPHFDSTSKKTPPTLSLMRPTSTQINMESAKIMMDRLRFFDAIKFTVSGN